MRPAQSCPASPSPSKLSKPPEKNELYTKSEIASLFPIIKGGSFDKLKSDRIVFGQVENRDPVDAGGGDPQDTIQSVVRADYNFSNKETLTLRYGTDRQTFFDGTNSNSPWNGFNTGTRLQNDTFSLSLTQAHPQRQKRDCGRCPSTK